MRHILIMMLLLAGCAGAPSNWTHPACETRKTSEVAYACSNNARLTAAFIADLNSKSRNEIRFFLVSTHAAWCETAAALTSGL